jgi:predicted nucleotidyltransferase
MIILEGITGSRAYGLDNKDSDTDIKGIYVAPTRDILGLFKTRETYDHVDPDWVYHEVGKFIELALKGNPTILEMLFLEGYTQLAPLGKYLVDNRHLFLSDNVKNSYGGYAFHQVSALNARQYGFGHGRNKRYEKHARHCFRLLLQGRQLLESGTLQVRVTPEQREELFAVGKLPVSDLVTKFTDEYNHFRDVTSVLPPNPDKDGVNKILLKIRKGNW